MAGRVCQQLLECRGRGKSLQPLQRRASLPQETDAPSEGCQARMLTLLLVWSNVTACTALDLLTILHNKG